MFCYEYQSISGLNEFYSLNAIGIGGENIDIEAENRSSTLSLGVEQTHGLYQSRKRIVKPSVIM